MTKNSVPLFNQAPMFTLDKVNLADLRLLFLNWRKFSGESQRRKIFEYTSSVTKVDLSPVK